MVKKKFDRRRYIRVGLTSKVRFATSGDYQKPMFNGFGMIKDLSVEGIGFITEEKLTPNEYVKLEIFLPEVSKPLLLNGQVRWSVAFDSHDQKKLFDVGVKLFTLEDNDEGDFVRYVSNKLTDFLGNNIHL